MAYGRKRTARRRPVSKKRYTRRQYNRKGTAVAYRALRVARSATRRVAGEACKFELTPMDFGNTVYTYASSTSSYQFVTANTLNTITSGTPWIMPLNWVYTPIVNQQTITGSATFTPSLTNARSYQLKMPAYYKMLTGDITPNSGTELQYRLKYLYINAIFNSSTPGRLRFVIVRDKLPTDQGLTWYSATDSKRSVFNSNNINAQLNPLSNGRFVVLYDKTMQINTINPLKPFKYFRRMSNKIRNSTPVTPQMGWTSYTDNQSSGTNTTRYTFNSPPGQQTDPTPIGRNALYLMIFSDGCTFNYDNSDGATESNTFKLMSRVSYYNN